MKPRKKRIVISLDLTLELMNQLHDEAKSMGLKRSTYIRYLIQTHQKRGKK